MSVIAIASATPADFLDGEVQEALQICGGDPMKALRITLIANAFLEAELDRLSGAVPVGDIASRRTRKPANRRGARA